MTELTRRLFMASAPAALGVAVLPAWAAPLSDLELIARQKAQPSVVRLARALERLTSTVTFMTTGAHPDDEPSAMLAALRHNYGIAPVIYCMTRGEGGQNSIGAERGIALGVLRTREMQEASLALDARLAFGGQGVTDPVHDFGFSKDPGDTMARWGEDRVLERMVWAIRTYRPDIIFNCFNDVPGQHGQHRAAVIATYKAAELSGRADAYPQHIEAGLPVWEVPKIYDPAWGGGGATYDDEVPPPKATLTLHAPARDALTGATWPQIGEWSRACHLTQNMGRWKPEPQTEWPIHLRRVTGGGPGAAEADIREGIVATVGGIAALPGMSEDCAAALRRAQDQIDALRGSFTEPAAVVEKALALAQALEAARAALPEALRVAADHRLARKLREVDQLLAIASGAEIRAYTEGGDVPAGGAVQIATVIDAPEAVTVPGVEIVTRPDLSARTEAEGRAVVEVPQGAALTNPMSSQYDPLGGNGDAFARVTLMIGGRKVVVDADLEDALRIVPDSSAELRPEALVFNAAAGLTPARIEAVITNATLADLEVPVPSGWQISEDEAASANAGALRLTPPQDAPKGRVVLEPLLRGKPAFKVEQFSYPHIGRSVVPSQIAMQVQVVDAVLPDSKVAYIGSGNDNVADWIRRMGLSLIELTPDQVVTAGYEAFDTIVIGVFAFGKRPDLIDELPGLHDWVKKGGHLVTLYHRPTDGWDPNTVPPAYLKIGSPSIRFRVTDPDAEVTYLAPDHPLLNTPNKIGPEDWAGWDKERGLYFAEDWAEVYVPLLSMADPREAPLKGALLSAKIGEGRHTHTALVLHHQLDKLTPGAFRIMANLLQRA